MAYKYTSYIYNGESYVPITQPSSNEGFPYENILGSPIKIAHGASEYSYTNIAELKAGTYRISGYYKFDRSENSELLETIDYLMVTVTEDSVTGNKTASFETMENGHKVVNVVVYDENEVAQLPVYSARMDGVFWGTFTADESQQPEEPQEENQGGR